MIGTRQGWNARLAERGFKRADTGSFGKGRMANRNECKGETKRFSVLGERHGQAAFDDELVFDE